MPTATQPASSTTASPVIANRYDFVYFFEVRDGNPNGDPDAGNMPRIDPETGQGLVTDVCLKRKIRNFVGLEHGEQPPYEIYVKERAVLNKQHERAYQALELKPEKRRMPKDEAKAREVTAWMCRNFFDIRTFGRGHEHRCQLRPGPWTRAVWLRSLHRPAHHPRAQRHPLRRYNRGRGGEAAGRQPHHGPQVHHSLWPLPCPRFHQPPPRRSGSQRHRVFRGRP